MSVLAVILIVIGALLLVAIVGGYLATRRRERLDAGSWEEHVAAADRALEAARVEDKGWDRSLLDAAARKALAEQRPDFQVRDLHLVLVDDRPGTVEDRAHLIAPSDTEALRVVLARRDDDWVAERIE